MAEDKNIKARPIDDTDDIDLSELLDEVKATGEVAKENAEKMRKEAKEAEKETPNNDDATLTPLQKMKAAKESGRITSGLVASNDEIEKGKERTEFASPVYNDDRVNAWTESIGDLEKDIKNRDKVTIVRQPKTQLEYVQLMDEISAVKTQPDGTVVIDFRDKDDNPIPPQFIRVREEGDPLFDIGELKNPNDASEGTVHDDSAKTDAVDSTEDGNDEEEDTLSPEDKKRVKVLIDKTGFGNDFAFTEEERAKLVSADTIQVNEVKLIDIEAIKSKRSKRSFQEFINEYNGDGSRTTIAFPASGFKAQMTGMSYGEYADVSLSMDTITFDLYRKRLTVIYNNMTDISTGPFEDFEDFLKNFAYTDIQLALYGLYVSTESEEQEIPLQCGREGCRKGFNKKFSTRSLLRLEKCSSKFLEDMEKVATADAADYDEIRKNSAVLTSKYIKLPESGYIVEMGIASAYDFLYNFVPLMDENVYKKAFGDDPANTNFTNIIFLTSVRSIQVPDGDGYIECVGYKDILDAIYHIKPTDIQILTAYAKMYTEQYEYTFAINNITCPHCGHVTKTIPMEMDELVFQTYQRLTSTEIDLDHIQKI